MRPQIEHQVARQRQRPAGQNYRLESAHVDLLHGSIYRHLLHWSFRRNPVVSRRSFLTSSLAAGVCAFGTPIATNRSKYSTLATDLIHRSTVIDMLGLLTLDYRKLGVWETSPDRFRPSDFQRLKDSGVTIFHPAVGFVSGDIYKQSLADITGWNLFIARHPDDFLRIDSVSDIARAKAKGQIGIVIGQQNSVHFRTVDDVDHFYAMGQRVSQLTYDDNQIGGGSTDPKNLGLTPYGLQVVERMNRLGMAIDISHCSDRTALDAIDASSHAGAGDAFQLPGSRSGERALPH